MKHDGDCHFWGWNICTCGLLHQLMVKENAGELYPAFWEDRAKQDKELETKNVSVCGSVEDMVIHFDNKGNVKVIFKEAMARQFCSDWFQDVRDFHKVMGLKIGDKPSIVDLRLDSETYTFVENLIREEFFEVIEAFSQKNTCEVAKEIVDLIYVLIGTAVSCGIDLRPVWDEVQKSNMAKQGGGKRPDGKIIKPEGWQPPDIEKVIEEQY